MKRIQSRRTPPASHRYASGFALLEVLVALLIFMFGVLGMVGLQASMTKVQTESKLRADAAELASDVIARLWTDTSNLGAYNGASCASQTRCQEWQTKVAALMPAGSGSLSVDSTTGDVTVTINWTVSNGQAHRYVTSTTVAAKGS